VNPRLSWLVCLFLLLPGALPAAAQRFSYGVKAGVPITGFLGTPTSQNSPYPLYKASINRYAAGGTVELHLPFGFGIEIDGIYRHYGYSNGPYTSDKTSTGDWEFPILAKYRLPGKSVRPYVDAGISVDTLSGTTQTESLALLATQGRLVTTTTSDPIEFNESTTTGFVAGAGIDVRIRPLHIQPEVRYTRWSDRHFQDPGSPHYLLGKLDQVESLAGIAF
jgi:hypothetical protein